MSLTIAAIQAAVAEQFGVRLADMTSPQRARRVARPRQVAMYLAWLATDASYPKIGRCFRRHHTTVMHAVEVMCRLHHGSGPDFERSVDAVIERILSSNHAGLAA